MGGGNLPTLLPDPAPGISIVATRISVITEETKNTTGGGVTLTTKGNATLASDTETTATLTYTSAVTFQVDNATGLPIAGTEQHVAGYVDEAGNFVPIGEINTNPGSPRNGLIKKSTLTAEETALIKKTTTQTNPNGGKLQVGGTANIDGQTTTHGLDNSGNKITGVADGVAATDAANVGQLTAAVQTETDRAIGAEAGLQTNIDTEVTRATGAEGVLQTNIDTEATTRAAADASIRTDFAAADLVEKNARIAADNVLQTNISNEVTRATNAEAGLQNNINTETANRIAADKGLGKRIDKNSRGIAMVAAMTNTTINPGMCQAVDFNMAQFDGQTGFAFGYSYKINENLQLHTAGASTTDFEEVVARLGVSYQW